MKEPYCFSCGSIRDVYCIKDTEGLLNDKDCPSDKGKNIWDKLYEGRFKI